MASYNGPFQAKIAEKSGGNYSFAVALIAGIIAVRIATVLRLSRERRAEIMSVAY